jgi:light-regulated signal transduction histidine kinase (bacteriophytochrome)
MDVTYLMGEETEKNKGRSNLINDSELRAKAKTILLIEDEEPHAELVRRAFEENSAEWVIHHVESICDAFKWLEENKKPSLVIADYLLPDGTGEQLAVFSLKSGAIDYVVKGVEVFRELPLTAERAIREWKNLVRRRRVEEELEIYVRELERVSRDLEDFTLLTKEYADNLDEIGREYLEEVGKATERMKVLIEDLLMLSHIGRKIIEAETVDLNELLEEIKSDLSARIEERGGEVVAGKLPSISTQRVWMKELFINLIDNGLKFNRAEKPRVEVSCEEQERDYVFKVKDNGVGMKEKYLSRIFNPYEGLYTQEYESTTGLGLKICKKIVDKFNGNIWAKSRPEEGTTFYFSIPKI